MHEIHIQDCALQLLPEKAIYIDRFQSLLVADVHLGKAETFQTQGIPIPNAVNQVAIARLTQLCQRLSPQRVYILGDLFHSRWALVDEVLQQWVGFLQSIPAQGCLIGGNHDRHLIQTLTAHAIPCQTEALALGPFLLSHEPTPQEGYFNLCGHVHPCVRLKTRLDSLRLPCFYLDRQQSLLMLPSFGEFTGGYEVALTPQTTAYAVAENTVIPLEGITTPGRPN